MTPTPTPGLADHLIGERVTAPIVAPYRNEEITGVVATIVTIGVDHVDVELESGYVVRVSMDVVEGARRIAELARERASKPRYVAVRTAPGDVQLTAPGGSSEMPDAEAVDLALSLLASVRVPELEIDSPTMTDWADRAEAWLREQGGRVHLHQNFAERRAATAPPPDPS